MLLNRCEQNYNLDKYMMVLGDVIFYRKVMFSQACVKNSVHGGGVSTRHFLPGQTRQTPPPRQADTPQVDTPLGRHPQVDTPLRADTPSGQTLLWTDTPPADGHCSRRYASYWNAFLFNSTSTLSSIDYNGKNWMTERKRN